MLQFLTLSLFEFYNSVFNVIPLKHIITCSQLSQASRRWILQSGPKIQKRYFYKIFLLRFHSKQKLSCYLNQLMILNSIIDHTYVVVNMRAIKSLWSLNWKRKSEEEGSFEKFFYNFSLRSNDYGIFKTNLFFVYLAVVNILFQKIHI